ncbi:hypothetical protein [Clostridium intestinale]|uniref:hypothetical protein n=1 Tax=Clostridium intestinale TaxID=36845 RepID=UPI002DD61B05|nr:hypothetical protein [Clostridium intestinale]WRY52638.1 hypothetical protein P8F83_05435 [Clostridium intestinale]
MDNKKSLNQKTKENFNFVEPPAFSGSMHETDSPYETSQAKEISQIFEPPTVPGSMHETGYPEDYDEMMGNFLFINPNYKNIPMQQPINPEMMSYTNRPYNPGFPRPYYNQYGPQLYALWILSSLLSILQLPCIWIQSTSLVLAWINYKVVLKR